MKTRRRTLAINTVHGWSRSTRWQPGATDHARVERFARFWHLRFGCPCAVRAYLATPAQSFTYDAVPTPFGVTPNEHPPNSERMSMTESLAMSPASPGSFASAIRAVEAPSAGGTNSCLGIGSLSASLTPPERSQPFASKRRQGLRGMRAVNLSLTTRHHNAFDRSDCLQDGAVSLP
jgi:hypothetical protein